VKASEIATALREELCVSRGSSCVRAVRRLRHRRHHSPMWVAWRRRSRPEPGRRWCASGPSRRQHPTYWTPDGSPESCLWRPMN